MSRHSWRVAPLGAGVLVLLAPTACRAPNGTPNPPARATCTFANPLMPGADPSVVRHGGAYYLVQSRDGGIVVFKSDRLTAPARNPVRVWTRPDTGWNRANVWAPELQRIGGRWYIYYAASARPNSPFTGQRSGVLESVGDDPQGAYVDRGRLDTGGDPATRDDDVWAIDLTTAEIGGRRYAVWSGWERNADTDQTQQNLYIAPMDGPTRIAGPRVRLSAPDRPWEDNPDRFDLQEGPEVLQRGGQTFVVYSTRESWLPDYRYGMLRLVNPAAPLDPASWAKSAGPVFVRGDGVLGPGHGTFTESADGREAWHLYHAKTRAQGGWDDRVIRAQRFTWNADGTPNFGTPTPAGVRDTVPSGQACGP